MSFKFQISQDVSFQLFSREKFQEPKVALFKTMFLLQIFFPSSAVEAKLKEEDFRVLNRSKNTLFSFYWRCDFYPLRFHMEKELHLIFSFLLKNSSPPRQ